MKKDMQRLLILIFIHFALSSCDAFCEYEVYGKYAPVGYKNNYDTIQLKPDGSYARRVYDKNKKHILNMTSEWNFKNGNRITFIDFYLNLDDDLVRFPNNINDTGMTLNTYFETVDNTIQFCVGDHLGKNCYQKIK